MTPEEQAEYDAKVEVMDRWNNAIGHSITGLIPANGKGLITARVFYVVRHEDGSESVGNIGIVPEGEMKTAAKLILAIAEVLADVEGNRKHQVVESHKH